MRSSSSIHGTADRLVPIRNSERMFDALKAHDIPSEFMILEGAGHGFRGEDARRASEAMVAWFEKYLLAQKE